MKFSKVFAFSIAGFLALSVVVLTVRQIAIKQLPAEYRLVYNAQIEIEQGVANAMLLNHDKVVAVGDIADIEDLLPASYIKTDMANRTIKAGKAATSYQEDLLSKGVTKIVFKDATAEKLEDYYWGKEHGLYEVRLHFPNVKNVESLESDVMFIINEDKQLSALLGTLSKGSFADFVVMDNDKVSETWVGAVLSYKAP